MTPPKKGDDLEGIWCWGCARRFVEKSQPTKGPLEAVLWREGLCGKPDCPVEALFPEVRSGRKR